MQLDSAFIERLRTRLESHPIYAALHTLDDLRVFMRHHVARIQFRGGVLQALPSQQSKIAA